MSETMTITIAPADATDIPAILALLERNGLPQDGLDHVRTALVARAGESVVGSAALELYGRAALLRSVAVDASLRVQGLGQQLTRAALELARQQSVEFTSACPVSAQVLALSLAGASHTTPAGDSA